MLVRIGREEVEQENEKLSNLNRVGTLLVLLVAFCGSVQCSFAGEDWRIYKGKHFLVYYAADAVEAESIAGRCEKHYERIKSDLGFAKHDDFWLWDKRAKIYIYKDKVSFKAAVNAPDWAVGKAVAGKREIATFGGSSGFADSVLPHELTHLVLREYVGEDGEIPLWLNEGIAQWEEEGSRSGGLQAVRDMLTRGRVIPLAQLTVMNVKNISDPKAAFEFYAESASLVGFMMTEYGSDGFGRFCSQIKAGKKLDDALRFAYPESIRNIGALEVAWIRYLKDVVEVKK